MCEEYIKARHTRYYPLKPSALPTGLWLTVGADLFKFKGIYYLILVEFFFSGGPKWLNLVTKKQSQLSKR